MGAKYNPPTDKALIGKNATPAVVPRYRCNDDHNEWFAVVSTTAPRLPISRENATRCARIIQDQYSRHQTIAATAPARRRQQLSVAGSRSERLETSERVLASHKVANIALPSISSRTHQVESLHLFYLTVY